MKVTWEVNDFYCGKSRPQYTTIDKDDFYGCETYDDYMEVVEEAVQNDYEQLGYSIENINWGEIELPEKQN